MKNILSRSLKLNRVLFVLTLIPVMVAASFLSVSQAQASATFPALGWGLNNAGQLGTGNFFSQTRPIQMTMPTGIEGWTAMYAGNQFTLARTYDDRLFGWGINTEGQLALGLGNFTYQPIPREMIPPPGRSNWAGLAITEGVHSNFALSSNGELYGWGQGHLVGTGSSASMLYPTPQPVPVPACSDRWVSVYPRTTFSLGFTDTGRLFAWGRNDHGQIGIGSNAWTYNAPQLVPVPSGSERWTQVFPGANQTFALTNDNRLFGWGRNASGELGIGNISPQNSPHLIPLLPETTNWAGVTLHVGLWHAHAITPDHRLFAWGANNFGQLAQGDFLSYTTAQEVNPLPGMTNWSGVEVIAGGHHSIARTPDHRLFVWGWGAHGQLALGNDLSDRHTPQLVDPPTGHDDWQIFDILVGTVGHHSFAFVPFSATGEFDLTKVLEKPYDTPSPIPLTFSFRMVAHSFNNNEDQAVIDANFPVSPTLDSRDITRTITIDSSSDSELVTNAGGNIVELSSSTNILEGIEFTRRGVYSWTVYELPTTTPAVSSPSNVVFSQARYELRVYVRHTAGALGGAFYIYAVTLHRLTNPVTGADLNPPLKVDDLIFVNQYTRVTAANQHFEIRKTIDGDFANFSDTFTFEITLTRTALCPENRTFIGRVVDLAGNAVSPPRTYTFTTGVTQNVVLGHNQRLIFDGANAITLGSTFLVVEQACPFHIASVRVYSYNTAQPPAPYFVVHTNTAPDQPRTTNIHMIGANRNAALFTNTHEMPPPTGLFLTSGSPYLVLLAAGLLTTAYFSLRARKRIEELPIMH